MIEPQGNAPEQKPNVSASTESPTPASDGDVAVKSRDQPSSETTSDAGETSDERGSNGGWLKAFVRVMGSYSEPLDHILRLIGFFAAVGSGAALPLMTLVFGSSVDKFNSFDAGRDSSDELYRSLSRNALFFVYLFIARYVLVYVHATCFGITGIRAIRVFRQDLITSLIRQDITFIDSCSPGYVATTISSNADMVEHGMTEKIGTLVQAVSMLIAAFAVAFSQQWKLTLVTATTLPALLIAFYFTFRLGSLFCPVPEIAFVLTHGNRCANRNQVSRNLQPCRWLGGGSTEHHAYCHCLRCRQKTEQEVRRSPR